MTPSARHDRRSSGAGRSWARRRRFAPSRTRDGRSRCFRMCTARPLARIVAFIREGPNRSGRNQKSVERPAAGHPSSHLPSHLPSRNGNTSSPPSMFRLLSLLASCFWQTSTDPRSGRPSQDRKMAPAKPRGNGEKTRGLWRAVTVGATFCRASSREFTTCDAPIWLHHTDLILPRRLHCEPHGVASARPF